MKPHFLSTALLAWVALPLQAQEAGLDLWDLHYARGYLSMGVGAGFPVSRYVDGLDLSRGAEAYDLTIGLTVGHYTSVEIDVSYVEFDVTTVDHGKIAELTVATFIPQVRLQWPLARDRLVPWVSGGVGPATLTVNDRTSLGADRIAGWWRWGWGCSADVGLQWFVTPNIGLAGQIEYVRASRRTRLDKERFVQGTGAAANVTVGLHWHIPRDPPERLFPGVLWTSAVGPPRGPYFAVAFGTRSYSEHRVTQDARFDSRDGAEPTVGFSIGVDLTDRLGVGLSGHFHEIPIWTQVKAIEYATWLVVPELRVRLSPLGAIVPELMGGVGVGVGQTNDPQPANVDDPAAGFAGRGLSLAGTIGVGIGVALQSNVDLLIDGRYLHHRSSLTRAARPIEVDVSGTQLAAGLRFHFR